MGNTGSRERKMFLETLVPMLRQRRRKVNSSQIARFLRFVREQCPWFPEEGTMNVETWEKVGKPSNTYCTSHGPEKVPVDASALWNLIRDALDPVREGTKLNSTCEPDVKQLLCHQDQTLLLLP